MLKPEEMIYYKEKAATILETQADNILLVWDSYDSKYFRRITRIDPCVISSSRLNDMETICVSEGAVVFETKDKRPIRFIQLRIQHNTNASCYILCKKGDLFRIERQYRKYCRSLSNITIPIIEESKLNEIMNHTVRFYKARGRIKAYGIKATKGLLFQGRPGNGKSLICDYIERRMGITASRYTSDALVEGLSAIKRFNKTLSILDDIDIGFLSRKKSSTLCCSLLSKLDDGRPNETVAIRILTTNEDVTDVIDPAFFRPGRIDRTFYFNNPTRLQRHEFIDKWKIDVDKYLKYLLDHTEEFSFAEMQGIYTNLVIQKEIEEMERLDVGKAINHIVENRDKIKKDDHMGFQEEAS